MAFSINIDWHDELTKNFDNWENLGRQAIESKCNHTTQDKDNNPENRETNMRYSHYCEECGYSEDSAEPMMNYGYPLDIEPNEEDVLRVVNETNLTVMKNTVTDECYLVLTGGGMDLSQEIALAYVLLNERIPYDLCISVCTQHDLNFSGKKYRKLAKEIISELKHYKNSAEYKIKELQAQVKESLHEEAQRKVKEMDDMIKNAGGAL